MLAKRLKELREEKGLFQKDIAKILQITTSAYGFYEQGKRSPDTLVIQRLADFFNVSVDYLLGRSNIRNAADPKFNYNLDVSGLPKEAILQVEEYIEFFKLKYKSDSNSMKK